MRKKLLYSFLILLAILIVLLNYIAYNHSYNFTHYSLNEDTLKVYDTSDISITTKLKYILTGVKVPRPRNTNQPWFAKKTEMVATPKGKIEIWRSELEESNGTVIMFHGYSNRKSSLKSRAEEFYLLNYNVGLVDFLGSGGSDGNKVTIGHFEADQVKACYDYIASGGEKNIYLFGISMGAVATMKCIKDYQPVVKGIILECPFANMKTTIKNRFKNFGVPSFPMTDMLMLWGSYHAGFWTYDHNPADYAKTIDCPTLLMHGEFDHAVNKNEIDRIYQNLAGKKTLKTFPRTGHDIWGSLNDEEWKQSIVDFMIQTGTFHEMSPFYMDESEKTSTEYSTPDRTPVIKRGGPDLR